MIVQETVRELASYALSKKGAQLEFGGELVEDITKPRVKLPGISWGTFFEVENEDGFQPVLEGTFAELPVYADRLVEHQKKCPAIRETEWMARDGHIQMAVPLDANLPIAFLKSLIDEAYDLIWNKLDDHQRFRIERANGSFEDLELMNELIDLYNLQEHRKEIHGIAWRAILLRTKPSTEADIPLGSTKIGGIPDLPTAAQWPVYREYVEHVRAQLIEEYVLHEIQDEIKIGAYHMSLLVLSFPSDDLEMYPYYYRGIQLKPFNNGRTSGFTTTN